MSETTPSDISIAPAAAQQHISAAEADRRAPLGAGLHVETDLRYTSSSAHNSSQSAVVNENKTRSEDCSHRAATPFSVSTPIIQASHSSASMASTLSPASTLSSSTVSAFVDLTPLPSPFIPGDSPGPWNRSASRFPTIGPPLDEAAEFSRSRNRAPSSAKQKGYGLLMPAAAEAYLANRIDENNAAAYAMNRSISEFVPETLLNAKPRHVTVTGIAIPQPSSEHGTAAKASIHREEYLAQKRGLTDTNGSGAVAVQLPSPPRSNERVTGSGEEEYGRLEALGDDSEYLAIRNSRNKKVKVWKPVRQLGQGTFSKVVLATSERVTRRDVLKEQELDAKKLVAIKIMQHGPAGGADEDRVENQLKREIDILRSVSHPSLVHLKAFSVDEDKALLVLNYCPGGDLFDVATQHRELLQPSLMQRIFAELVDAVRYLHRQHIVHRDIKLENVLLNLRVNDLSDMKDFATYPHPVATLTDLGLSRRIDPGAPLLTTRCGSEDYAAPEILLGQEYDGRETDAWAMGVLLYALMEGRLPFDPPPGKPTRSRAAHRIARCDWLWVRFGDRYGEWVDEKGVGFEGPRDCVEGLLKKMGRKSLDEVAQMEWVRSGMCVAGGLETNDADGGLDEDELNSS